MDQVRSHSTNVHVPGCRDGDGFQERRPRVQDAARPDPHPLLGPAAPSSARCLRGRFESQGGHVPREAPPGAVLASQNGLRRLAGQYALRRYGELGTHHFQVKLI